MRTDMWRPFVVLFGGAALTAIAAFVFSGVFGTLGTASLVFFGIALTLVALAILPVDGARLHWPLGPAAVFSIFGWMFMVEAAALPAIVGAVWPIVVIGYFAWDVVQAQHGTTPAIHA